MFDRDGSLDIRLDPKRFIDDQEIFRIAVLVAVHAEQRRSEYQKSEKPLTSFGSARSIAAAKPAVIISHITPGFQTFFTSASSGGGFYSDMIPWYEWMVEPQVLQPCAESCGITMAELADTIAYRIKPKNWQTFMWMSEAIRGRERTVEIEEAYTRQSVGREQQIKIEREEFSRRGLKGAIAKHAQSNRLKEWAVSGAASLKGSATNRARELLKAAPEDILIGIKSPERVMREAIKIAIDTGVYRQKIE